jgi:hypothetical protein
MEVLHCGVLPYYYLSLSNWMQTGYKYYDKKEELV